jgi:hypothetical protein
MLKKLKNGYERDIHYLKSDIVEHSKFKVFLLLMNVLGLGFFYY